MCGTLPDTEHGIIVLRPCLKTLVRFNSGRGFLPFPQSRCSGGFAVIATSCLFDLPLTSAKRAVILNCCHRYEICPQLYVYYTSVYESFLPQFPEFTSLVYEVN